MMSLRYKGWLAFRYKGKEWLALDKGEAVEIYGLGFAFYGSFYTVKNFKKFYDEDGEGLLIPLP